MPSKLKKVTNPTTIAQHAYADKSRTQKVAEAGLYLAPKGEISAAKEVGESQPVMIYNDGAAVAYVIFGDKDVAAPTNAATGIPVAAKEKIMLNSGEKTHVRASANTVYAYSGDNE
jgi:hypothetical protein